MRYDNTNLYILQVLIQEWWHTLEYKLTYDESKPAPRYGVTSTAKSRSGCRHYDADSRKAISIAADGGKDYQALFRHVYYYSNLISLITEAVLNINLYINLHSSLILKCVMYNKS